MTPELKNRIPADLFQNTTTSYKFFWTIGILELLKLTGRTVFELKYIIARMVSTALFVLNNHPVNLGGADHFKVTLSGLKRLYPHAWDTENGLFEALVRDINTNTIRRIIGYYTENVPYRFLTPWIGTKFVRADLSQDEVMFGLDAPYSIESRTSDRILRINPSWASAIQGNEDELISLVIDQLDKYIHSRGTSLSSDVLPNIKSLIATQDASPLSAGAIKAMIQSESVVSPFLYRGVTQTTTTTGLTKKEKPSSIIQPKPLAVTPVKREEIKPVPQKVAEPKKTDTTDVIANGKIITVRNPEILKEILPLIETNKLDAIAILYKHYENVEGLQMSFIDWGNLVERIRQDNRMDFHSASFSPNPVYVNEFHQSVTALRTNDTLPAFQLVKERLSNEWSYDQILEELGRLESEGHTEYRSKLGKPITKAIISHWAKELGYDVKPGGKAKDKLNNWKRTNEGYQWFKKQVLSGVLPGKIIEEYNRLHIVNPQSFSTPLGSGMTISTYNRWRKDIVATNTGFIVSKAMTPSTQVSVASSSGGIPRVSSVLDGFYKRRGIYNVIEWAKGQEWWNLWKKDFKLFAEETINEFLDGLKSPANLIASAFHWSLTAEGWKYWAQADKSLKMHIKSDILVVLDVIRQQVSTNTQFSITKERFSILIGYDEAVFSDEINLEDLCKGQGLCVIEHTPDVLVFMRK